MLFRVKIAKCLDAIVEASSYEEAVELARELSKICPSRGRVYVHELELRNGEIVDRGLVREGMPQGGGTL